MKIITYSDLHFEFGADFTLPDYNADVMILAGDICVLRNIDPLDKLLAQWNKPALYIMGNHEYYTHKPISEGNAKLRAWLNSMYPNVHLLLDESIVIEGVNFFGGTMWTNFMDGDRKAITAAENSMNDFRFIRNDDGTDYTAVDSIALHNAFVEKLISWFETPLVGERVVITHHAPVINPKAKYRKSPLAPAFNSLNMVPVIEKYQPALWVYGHTHECDCQTIGRTKIISNQRGYPDPYSSGFECSDFSEAGHPISV